MRDQRPAQECRGISASAFAQHRQAEQLLAYNRETTIAEKFEAMTKLGELNSRMKDFFDIWLLATSFEFEGSNLAAAAHATFSERQTLLEIDPICFSDAFAYAPSKTVQWKAFVRRGLLTQAPAEFADVVKLVRDFLRPVAQAILENRPFIGHWPPAGPW